MTEIKQLTEQQIWRSFHCSSKKPMPGPMPNPEIYQDSTKWVELGATVQRVLESLPSSSWRLVLPKAPDELTGEHERAFLRQKILQDTDDLSDRCAEKVLELLKTQRLPVLADDEAGYLRMMFSRIDRFLRGSVIGLGREPSTIFSFPKGSVAEVLLWFCFEWWVDCGLKEIVLEATTDEAIVFQTFGGVRK